MSIHKITYAWKDNLLWRNSKPEVDEKTEEGVNEDEDALHRDTVCLYKGKIN